MILEFRPGRVTDSYESSASGLIQRIGVYFPRIHKNRDDSEISSKQIFKAGSD
jgi:ribosomal protein S16